METFTALKSFCYNPHYQEQRSNYLLKLDIASIDAPIVELVRGFMELPFCFTLQSCCGHFMYSRQKDPYNTEPLSPSDSKEPVEYRIAYLALCIENSEMGMRLFRELKRVPEIDPSYIQFGSPDWFWDRQVNSYALQVEPERYRTKDSVRVYYQEALYIQGVRDRCLTSLNELLRKSIARKMT
jgi:hypothetical protein